MLIFFGELLPLPIGHVAAVVGQHSESCKGGTCLSNAGTLISYLKDSIHFVPLSGTHNHFSKKFVSLTTYLHSTLV